MERKKLTIDTESGKFELPYLHIGDMNDKKKVFISGGIHGDEVNGIEAVRAVSSHINKLYEEGLINGSIYIFPVLNPWGFEKGSRFFPPEKKDLNRQFGKDPKESISAKIVNTLTDEILKKCTMGVDFHDAGYGAKLLPHARIHRSDEEDCVSCSRELASYFGTDFVLERDGKSSMLAVNLNDRHDTPVITVEMGGSKILDPYTKDIAVRGVHNILVANGITDGELDMPEHTYLIKKRVALNTKFAGILQMDVELGEKLQIGQKIGRIFDPILDKELPIRSPKNGILFSVWPNDLISKGSAIGTIVCLDDKDAKEEIIPEGFSVKPFDL